MRFSEGTKVFSKLMNITGVVKGYSNGRYAIQQENGYVWYLDNKAELVEIN